MEIIQTSAGTKREIKSRYGEKRNVTINREYRVEDGAGNFLGKIRYVMVTHERRTPGKRYVNARWQSPGWQFQTASGRGVYWRDSDTKKWALEMIESDARRQLAWAD
jgi:uncharacterized protein YqjF (DUF2071 family)